MIQRALISVSDKKGIVDLGRGLAELGIEIISTGGTAQTLREAGLPVTPIEVVTGYPEMLGGRVKTLHPMIHGGLLARRHVDADEEDLHRHGIVKIDLVVVNLYPFEQTVSRKGTTLAEAIEQIDIGGVALLRAAAKNFQDVTVLSNPGNYEDVLAELREHRRVSDETRARLAVQAFRATARYDRAIAEYLARESGHDDTGLFPSRLELAAARVEMLRYGENPHQQGALYAVEQDGGLANSRQLHGKGMSYTNWLDAEAAWSSVLAFDEPAVVIVKHASPCGIATNNALVEAWRGALASDPVSAFGGVVAMNRAVDVETADALGDMFVELILAPGFEPAAATSLKRKRDRRLLEVPPHKGIDRDLRGIPGGYIVQERDHIESRVQTEVVTSRAPSPRERAALEFAWRAVVGVKSNAILLASPVEGGFASVGIGSGQPSRVDAVDMAVKKAGPRADGSVLASDAFFPFPDGIEAAARAGVTAIIQPGGSVRDDEAIAVADNSGVAMIMTGTRHFRH